jgi:hypothetical protein
MPEKLRRLLRVILYPILFLIGSLVHAIVLLPSTRLRANDFVDLLIVEYSA